MRAYRKGLDFVVTPCGLSLSLSLSHDKFFVSEGSAAFAALMIHNEGETNNDVGLKTEQCMLQDRPINFPIT
jgi:hypothetical protein